MKYRFESLGLNLVIYDGVEHSDVRISDNETRTTDTDTKRIWSVTYGHLDMIREFYNSDKKYGFFCEYDIVVCADFVSRIPQIMEDFDNLNIDILLLGYMTTSAIESGGDFVTCELSENTCNTYHNYPDDLWGVHLYMLDKAGAKLILDMYSSGFAEKTIIDPSLAFSPDWTISKIPRRALIYPMIAVEDGSDDYEHYGHYGQYNYHMETFKFNTQGRDFV
jgi:hypothetical protein